MFNIIKSWENFKTRQRENRQAAWMNFKAKLPEKLSILLTNLKNGIKTTKNQLFVKSLKPLFLYL